MWISALVIYLTAVNQDNYHGIIPI